MGAGLVVLIPTLLRSNNLSGFKTKDVNLEITFCPSILAVGCTQRLGAVSRFAIASLSTLALLSARHKGLAPVY